QTSYRLGLGFVHGQREFTLTSSLSGLGSALPEPMHKAADTSLPLRVQTNLLSDGKGPASRDQVRFELGTVAQAQFVRDVSRDVPQVLSGGIGLLEALP